MFNRLPWMVRALLAIMVCLQAPAVNADNIQILTLPTGSKAYRAGVTLAAAVALAVWISRSIANLNAKHRITD